MADDEIKDLDKNTEDTPTEEGTSETRLEEIEIDLGDDASFEIEKASSHGVDNEAATMDDEQDSIDLDLSAGEDEIDLTHESNDELEFDDKTHIDTNFEENTLLGKDELDEATLVDKADWSEALNDEDEATSIMDLSDFQVTDPGLTAEEREQAAQLQAEVNDEELASPDLSPHVETRPPMETASEADVVGLGFDTADISESDINEATLIDENALDLSEDGLASSNFESLEERAREEEVLEQTPAIEKMGHSNIDPDWIEENRDFVAHHQDKLIQLQATIKGLREDRESILEISDKLRFDNEELKRKMLNMRAELDESKIELSILKKREVEEAEELRYRVRLAEDKKKMLEEKNALLKEEFERLNHKVRIDFQKIREREKILEGQLEMVKVDSSSQIQTRDNKILELKRKIDALEFNMENIAIREEKSRQDKFSFEKKLERVMRTLRLAIEVLETDEFSGEEEEVIKKLRNLG